MNTYITPTGNYITDPDLIVYLDSTLGDPGNHINVVVIDGFEIRIDRVEVEGDSGKTLVYLNYKKLDKSA